MGFIILVWQVPSGTVLRARSRLLKNIKVMPLLIGSVLQLTLLQASVLDIWSRGKTQENIRTAKAMAISVAKANALATLGRYEGSHPSTLSGSLKETFRGWI